MFKITDTFLEEIADFGLNGEGVTRIDDVPVFVPYAVKGDLCKIKITDVKKNIASAKLVKVVRPSSDREEPKCDRFYECGGCVYQHIKFSKENEIKRELLSRTLKKAGIDREVSDIVSADEYGYRNKLQLPFSWDNGQVVLGFFRRGSHDVVPLSKCILHGGWAEKIISIVTYWANEEGVSVYNEETHEGLLRHLVVRRVGDFFYITLVINGKGVKGAKTLYDCLRHELDCALYISVNEKKNNVIMGDSVKLLFGEEKYVDIDGIKAKLSPMSFLQVNDQIRKKLYEKVSKEINDADYIFDAYSGIGLLTAMLAKDNKNAKVYGLEIVKEATENANTLMRDNGLLERVTNICGDATINLPKLVNDILNDENNALNCNICTVIDPPRKGCDEKVLSAIIKSESNKVVYISCNPATLSRDLKVLSTAYEIEEITPFNMFPRTSELETVAVLRRR